MKVRSASRNIGNLFKNERQSWMSMLLYDSLLQLYYNGYCLKDQNPFINYMVGLWLDLQMYSACNTKETKLSTTAKRIVEPK